MIILHNALLVAELLLGTLLCLLGTLNVNFLWQLTVIRKNYGEIRHNLHKPFGNCGVVPLPISHVFQLTCGQKGYKRLMTRKDSQKSVKSSHNEMLAFTIKENSVACDYFKVEDFSHDSASLYLVGFHLLSLGDYIVNRSGKEKCGFGTIVHFAVYNHFEASYHFAERHIFSLESRENLTYAERL